MEILRRPRLVQFVQKIEVYLPFDRELNYEMSPETRKITISERDKKLLRNAVRNAGFEDVDAVRVLDMLLTNKEFATMGFRARTNCAAIFIGQTLAALLISVSPSLVALQMTKPNPGPNPELFSELPLAQIHRETNANPNSKPFLQNLRKVYMINDEAEMENNGKFYLEHDLVRDFTLFDQLPSIETVGIDIMTFGNGKSPYSLQPINISRFAINHSFLDTWHLLGLIKARKETLEELDVDAEEARGFATEAEIRYGEYLRSIWDRSGSLKSFSALERLRMGVGFLYYFANGVRGSSDEKCEKVRVVGRLPENLESLCIIGYQQGMEQDYDDVIDELEMLCASGISKLKEILGLGLTIPHAENVADPDGDKHLLWSLLTGFGSRENVNLDMRWNTDIEDRIENIFKKGERSHSKLNQFCVYDSGDDDPNDAK
ncbi:hypothetical protein N7532_011231 [Penicillium argentinense]|uniref:Uncharacterized protein n=1 Tax=Penicillium argentinense TaxID=1131581 RepID=A0A9W9EI16_9EURO|nr:uncharacterized protein N7532_011231 [Penicillium argentinense]KAJ5082188.1 hypothetical protein N7532_011231 [Penicillium argentinense]